MAKGITIGLGVVLVAVLVWLGLRGPETYAYDSEKAVYHKFSGALAMEHVENLVTFGPRPAGSEALEASRQYIEAQLEALGWATQRQAFDDETPVGTVNFVNLRARFVGEGGDAGAVWNTGVPILIGSHYDTKLYRDFEFVGANDGGSSTGALIEIARVTALRPLLARKLELIFFDGEEAFEPNITATDGLYGSRYYAREMRRWPAEQRPQEGIILDLIGDKNLNIGVPNDSPFHLHERLQKATKDLGYSEYFGVHDSAIIDDHVPLNNAGVPTIDIIDLDFGPWHTAGDTLDKISADSLRIVGSTALLMVEKYLLGEQ